jgi:RimJ/RimL family protein N-acetyltransferase
MNYRKIIRGKNCYLKKFEKSDEKLTELLYKLFTNKEISDLINPEYLEYNTKPKLRKLISQKASHPCEVWYIIIHKKNYIGYVCYKWRMHYDEACEISTAILKEHQGLHLGFESSLILVNYLEALGKFKYIVAYTHHKNKKAENNLKKIGFKKTNRLQKIITQEFYNEDGTSDLGRKYNLMVIKPG